MRALQTLSALLLVAAWSAAYGQAPPLDQSQPEAVAKAYLAHRGVAASRIDTISFGVNDPAVKGHDERAWAANRRDEVKPLAGS